MKNWLISWKSVYKRTTILEGTVHSIKGLWKMIMVFFISLYWCHNFGKAGKNISIFPKVKINFPKNFILGNGVSINKGTCLRSENTKSKVKIDDNVHIGMHVDIDCSGGIEIGKRTVISDKAVIHTHNHGLNPWGKATYKRLTIGKNVWIGGSSIILPKVSKIGEGSVIGAGTVVTKDVPKNSVVAGNPAKVIKKK